MRATSSTRSASRVTSLRRKCGTVHVEAVRGAPRTPNPSARRISAWRGRGDRPRRAARATRCVAQADRPSAGGPVAADVDRARARSVAPVSSTMSRVATTWASMRLLGREALLEARRWPRCAGRASARCGGCSGRPSWRPPSARASCPSWTSERAPPMTPAIDVGPSASSMTSISASSVRTWPSSVVDLLAVARAAHDEPPAGDAVEVEGVQRLAGRAASRSW